MKPMKWTLKWNENDKGWISKDGVKHRYQIDILNDGAIVASVHADTLLPGPTNDPLQSEINRQMNENGIAHIKVMLDEVEK